MATYLDLYNITQDAGYGDLAKKIAVAVEIKAYTISTASPAPNATLIAWAQAALLNPDGVRKQVEHYVFAANSGNTISQIINATDTAIQNNVDSAVDTLLGK